MNSSGASKRRRPCRLRVLPAVVLVALAMNCAPAAASPHTGSPHWWQGMVFDDFDDFEVTSRYWNYEYGRPGIVNHELQEYTDSRDNVRIDALGNLVIEARRTGGGYTSGRLSTRGKLDMMYGTITARIKAPSGQGIWPAFWLLGSDIDTVGWPECGEIDIMELVSSGTTYHVSIHGPPAGSEYADSDAVSTQGPITDLTTDFHNYWVTRRPGRITIGVDQRTLGEFTPDSLPSYARWVFERPMYAVLNVAVGGDWPGPPDPTTPFPATMLVDWFSYTP
ncbi:glycoside hydrolase family 16 protein [Mycolicibacterium cosmeticum]|uniref:glycoside hydrolase family 16 protein n=1 Tax=Mycolicibacterium cosmeticum TaxID=258533 RepID=UPI0032049C17